jgi:ABC-type transporter Mla subunit MlaD
MIGANKFRLGLFVLAGIVLFLGALFFLGLSDMFTKKAKFATFFNESVQGLAVGSPVKYKGVPIGTVSKITIELANKIIRVDMDIELKSFTLNNHLDKGRELEEFYKFFRNERSMGLRCRLEYAGITGLKYIEMDYFDPDQKCKIIERPKHLGSEYLYIPSSPSVFKDILKLMNRSLERIAKIDFEKISEDLTDTLQQAKKLLGDPKLKQAVHQLERMSDNLEKSTASISKVLTEKKIRDIVNSFADNLKGIEKLVERIDKTVKAAKLDRTSNAFREAAESVNETKQMLTNTLMKLDQTFDSITELINYLNDDPSALLKGKRKPKIVFPKKSK